MEYNILFERIPCFINKVDMNICVIRIHFSSTLVNRQEYRFNTRSCLSHQAGCSGGSDSQAGNVASSVFLHFFIQLRIGFCQTLDERIVLLAFVVVYFESTALFRHFYRRTISAKSYCLMYFF